MGLILSLFVGILLTASGGTDAAVAQQDEARQEKPLSIQQRLRAALEKQLRENASPGEMVPVEPAAEGEDPNLAKIKRIGGKLISLGARGTWSPDGTRLAFGKDPFNSGIIFLANLDFQTVQMPFEGSGRINCKLAEKKRREFRGMNIVCHDCESFQ